MSQGDRQFGIEWGWCLWLSMASLVLAVSATLLLLRSLQQQSTSPDLDLPDSQSGVDQ
jgi:hypothetical protein